jgi:hypothetical protein
MTCGTTVSSYPMMPEKIGLLLLKLADQIRPHLILDGPVR